MIYSEVVVDAGKIDEVVEKVAENPGIISTWIATLPQKGFDLGIRALLTAIIVVVGYFITKMLRKMARHTLNKLSADAGTVSFVDSVIKFLCYALLLMLVLLRFGVDAATIVALVGSLGLTIGLALQGCLQNFAGGIIILFVKPFRVGDYIYESTKGNEGTVLDIGLVFTEIITVDGKNVYIPNATLANAPIINYTKGDVRTLSLSVGISYKSDIALAKNTIIGILGKYDVSKNPVVFVESLGDSSIHIRFRANIPLAEFGTAATSVFEEIKLEFDRLGIEIPYNQLDVHIEK